ncbi:DUF402 domain-containing protein [Corynebacterium vitaeruminis]|uniref:DUF402 domain-containing protein n=1 Tax=Corynebacterium vitaeruminis TaxID=38305 RepID=UPI00066081E6|nr:DUF402 domain-containing protein [Corynebacterium vitaeruminis]
MSISPAPSPSSSATPAPTSIHSSQDTHPPKAETFNLREMVNIDPKGFRRKVDEFQLLTPNRLYMRRGMDHPKFGYLESFLLADEGLRISIYHFRPGVKVEHQRYVDIVSIDHTDPQCWRMTDLYLDILQAPSDAEAVAPLPADAATQIRVEDVDELVAAHTQGLISDELTEFAIETTLTARAAIAAHGDSIDAWMQSLNLNTTWADAVELSPAV